MWGLKTTFLLLKYVTDITMQAEMGKLNPVIGREKEIEELIQALLKRRNSNAFLVGDAGVGKTAIVEALAIKIAAKSVPPKLIGKRVFSIDMARLADGAIHGREFEKRVKDVLEEVRANEGWVILFIDDLHNLIKDREDDGVATILKSALATNDFKCIGAIRVEEYRRYIERDGALKSMFETIQVCEPSREDCYKMLKGIIHKYQNHHGAIYSQNALISAVNLSKQYFRELLLPGKAINLIDKAGARAHVLGKTHVSQTDIEHVVSTSTGLRVTQASLLQLEDILKRNIIGQDEAVADVCGSIRRARVRTIDEEEEEEETKPIGCFLFAGPTGVGKTEMAKVLAKDYFGDEAAMVRLDTRKSMEYHTVSRLINQLTEEVRRRPHSLVLFDEIEKAHEQVLNNVVLEILEFGRVTDGEGKTVDFSDTIVILTSNFKDALKAEVVNRLDKVVMFKPLEREHIENILDLMIERFHARVAAEKKIHQVEFSKRLKEWLIQVGYNTKSSGARALKRAFASSVETKLADEILRGTVAQGDTVMLDITLTGEVEVKNHQTLTTSTRDRDRDRDGECRIMARVYHQTLEDSNSNIRMAIGGVDVKLLLPLLPNNHKVIEKDCTVITGIESESFSQLLQSLPKIF